MFYASRLPLLVNENGASAGTVKDNLFAAVSAESARLESAVAVVDGSVVMSFSLPWYGSESISFISWCKVLQFTGLFLQYCSFD